MNAPKHILDGYKVIDISQYIAGPTATRSLAEMGADVIKIEIAKAGDRSRRRLISNTAEAATSFNRT